MFVDFTGKKLTITDKATNQKTPVEVFVATLGASQLTYVEAVPSQKKDNWIKVNQNALNYFGGAPRLLFRTVYVQRLPKEISMNLTSTLNILILPDTMVRPSYQPDLYILKISLWLKVQLKLYMPGFLQR